MAALNKAMIIGRLGKDPEVRYTQNNTAVANMSVATSEKYKDSNGNMQETTEWHNVVAWARLAEICQQYLTKGSLVYFEGPLQTRSWDDKDGKKQYMTEIKALSMQMLDTRRTGEQHEQKPPEKEHAPAQQKIVPDTPDVGEVDDIDSDLPF